MKPLDGELKKAQTILKGHRIDLKRRSEIAKQVRLIKSKKKSLRDKNAIVSLNTIFKKSRQLDLDLKRTKSKVKKVRPSSKSHELLFVVRNFRTAESSTSLEVLKNLYLLRPNTGRFMSNSPSNIDLLNKVFPFVYYGTPTYSNVRDLLQKRGTVISGSRPKLISSNVVVEDSFSNFGLYSLSELIDCIFHGNGSYEDILSKLGPINLSNLDIYSRFVFIIPIFYLVLYTSTT